MNMHRHPRPPGPACRLAAVLLAAAGATALAADAPLNPVAAANTAFALDLYWQLAAAPGNLFFSPYSISRALAMAAAGARGPTAAEMDAVLHLKSAPGQIAAGYGDLTKSLQTAAGGDIDLVSADSLWVQDQYPLRADYLRTVRSQFGAEARPADFVHRAAAARDAINAWVGSRTDGRIPELIGPGVLDASTRAVLCDAIYFKGKWDHPFKPRETGSALFHLTPTAEVAVPTMHQTSMFRVTHQDNVGLLELPYRGRHFSMVLFLPDTVDGLPGIEQKLTAEQLHVWLAELDFAGDAMVRVSLPKFTARERLPLTAPLTHLGMRAAFDPAAADFSGMATAGGLYLSAVVHQAYVKVDEEGTEAAAATGAAMAMFGIPRSQEFNVDHPFLFLIRDNTTGTILFLGRIVDPR
jgi:serine protease inhibitor